MFNIQHVGARAHGDIFMNLYLVAEKRHNFEYMHELSFAVRIPVFAVSDQVH